MLIIPLLSKAGNLCCSPFSSFENLAHHHNISSKEARKVSKKFPIGVTILSRHRPNIPCESL